MNWRHKHAETLSGLKDYTSGFACFSQLLQIIEYNHLQTISVYVSFCSGFQLFFPIGSNEELCLFVPVGPISSVLANM